MTPSSKSWTEGLTLLMRLLTFVVALMLGGAFFLPWIRLDGEGEAHSGAELISLLLTPDVQYLYAISPVQTGVLIGCTVLTILATVLVVFRYSRRKSAILATMVVLASCIAIIYATGDLAANTGARTYIGLTGTIGLSAILLIHQSLIKLRTRLYQRRKLPSVYRVLGVATGSGYYRWNDNKAI